MEQDPSSMDIFAPLPSDTTECPDGFEMHKTACYKFGSHSSYELAKAACEQSGARLANIEATHGKFVTAKVRSMGGNDFWIGSFVNRGKVYRQVGRANCPVMRGQLINDAPYGMVNCNSANRYVCQKYGPDNKDIVLPPTIPSAIQTTDLTTGEPSNAGGTSPVVYVVIAVLAVILLAVGLKILLGKYLRDKMKSEKKSVTKTVKSKSNEEKGPANKGTVFYPTRKGLEPKSISLDSAVPPSVNSEKLLPLPEVRRSSHGMEDAVRMGRPRVNGSAPTRRPPGISESQFCRSAYGQPRRHYSDPRSEYGRKTSFEEPPRYYSDSSDSTSSETDSSDGQSSYSSDGYGPRKVYQRQSSRSNHPSREHYRGDGNTFNPPIRHHHQGSPNRSKRSLYGNNYSKRFDGIESRDQYARDYNMSCQRQYFPEPHRLVSWNNMAELNEFTRSQHSIIDSSQRSLRREPIRVHRKIHQDYCAAAKGVQNGGNDIDHIYEELDATKRQKLKMKASKRNERRSKREERSWRRQSESRASTKSKASIKSRKLPTPPL